MKKVKMTARLILIAVFALAMNVFGVSAQTEESVNSVANEQALEIGDGVDVGAEEMVRVSSINFSEASISSREENKLAILVELVNGEKAESNISYIIELRRDVNGNEAVIEKKIFPNTFSLSSNGQRAEILEYEAPPYLKGSYSIFIYAENEVGMMLSLTKVGDVEFNGTGQFVETGECYLTVEGDSEEFYFLKEGVDIRPEEKLIVNCRLNNHFDLEKKIVPRFNTTSRSLLGEKVEVGVVGGEVISLLEKEEKEVSIEILTTDIPQAYEVEMSLYEGDQVISNPIYLHYVIVGESGTIQNVRLDKTGYRKGEIISANVYITGSADAFSFSRTGGTGNEENRMKVIVRDDKENACTDSIEGVFDAEQPFIELQSEAIIDCINPQVSVELLGRRAVLDSKVFSFTSIEEDFDQTGSIVDSSFSSEKIKFLIVLSLLVIILLAMLTWILLRVKRGKFRLRVFLLFVLINSAFLFLETRESLAGSHCHSSRSNNVCATVNVASQYCAGNVSISVTANKSGCANYYYRGSVNAVGRNIISFSEIGRANGDVAYGTLNLSDWPVGNHTIPFHVNTLTNCLKKDGRHDCTKDKAADFYFTENIRIVDCTPPPPPPPPPSPPPAPVCSSAYNGKSVPSLSAGSALCSSGSAIKFREHKNSYGTVISYSWGCQNSEAESVSCSATRICPANWVKNNPPWGACPTVCPSPSSPGVTKLYQKRTVTYTDLNRCKEPYNGQEQNPQDCGECGKCGIPNLTVNCGVSNSPLCGAGGNDCCSSGWMYRPNENLMSRIAPVVDNVNV
ncbi:MAG TPA: hypothetical protein GX706_02325, partial [Candidatus Moranbacteria bacterium]|nr:hypothetical protein [Candidatus Moranbacteria bacterium]